MINLVGMSHNYGPGSLKLMNFLSGVGECVAAIEANSQKELERHMGHDCDYAFIGELSSVLKDNGADVRYADDAALHRKNESVLSKMHELEHSAKDKKGHKKVLSSPEYRKLEWESEVLAFRRSKHMYRKSLECDADYLIMGSAHVQDLDFLGLGKVAYNQGYPDSRKHFLKRLLEQEGPL